MHTALCEEMFATMGSIGIHERHLQRLLKSKAHLQFGLKYALGQVELTDTDREPPGVVELPGGGLAFQQAVDPLPFDAKDWQIFMRQRNTKAQEHMRCNLDAAKSNALTEQAFNEPLEPDVSSIFLVETSQARIRPDQAHEMLAGVAPGSARRTRPALTFEVLRYFWDELNNLNAAYVVINAAIKGVGYPVIFNSLSNGKRLTFVPGVPQQHAEYTGYYACCA